MGADALYLGRDFKLEHDRTMRVADANLKYTVIGDGEPVLLIHCTSIADGLVTPLVRFCPELLQRYQFISYYRAGYNGSTLDKDGLSIEEMADHAAQVLDNLGIAKAHVVAYSFGGVVGFQFLLSHASRVGSAVLLEPYLLRESPEAAAPNNEAIQRAFETYGKGDKLGAATTFMADVCGPNYLGSVDLSCALDVWNMVEESADVTFGVDFPALAKWGFQMSRADEFAVKPTMPVLAAMGQDSEAAMPGFREVQRFLLDWLPQAERAGIPGASHGMQLQNPVAVGDAIDRFLTRHPLT